MKIYVPRLNEQLNNIGGGFTFIRNLHKALRDKVEFVDNWKECDIVFIFGITTFLKEEVYDAINAGKKLVLRVDNIPRKSRNRRQSPAERLTEFGNIANAVIYQGTWCKEYAGYFIKNDKSYIINNGVDKKIFNTEDRNSDGNTYLYINYNDNPNKRFDEALYLFDMAWRKNNKARLIIAGNAPQVYIDNPDYNWDLPTPGTVIYEEVLGTPGEVAKVMKKCDYLLYPAAMEAYPNTLLEGMSCGLKPIGVSHLGGSLEVYNKGRVGSIKSIEEMGKEYLQIFENMI